MLLDVGRESKCGSGGGTSLMSHTSYLQPAAGRKAQEAAGHGAAQLSLAMFGYLRWRRARGTRHGTAHLGCAGATALPGGCVEQHTSWT